MRFTKSIVILIAVLIPLTTLARWRPPTEWTYTASYNRVWGIAKTLPKTLPLKIIRAKSREKKMTFKSDWGEMDIAKETTLTFTTEKKETTVKITGCAPLQSYKILREIGDKLKQPLPAPPRRHRY